MTEPEGGIPPDNAPPAVPDIDRRVRLYRHQVIGLAALVAITGLALAGFAETSTTESTAVRESLSAVVEHTTRTRLTQRAALSVVVTNTSAGLLDHVDVFLPAPYMKAFIMDHARPEPSTDGVIRLTSLEAGERRRIEIRLTADAFGRHAGAIRLASSAGETIAFEIRTLTLP